MEDRTLKRIVIVKDAVSNLNANQMSGLFGRGYSDECFTNNTCGTGTGHSLGCATCGYSNCQYCTNSGNNGGGVGETYPYADDCVYTNGGNTCNDTCKDTCTVK